ncbi:MAG TPA: ATP-binding protein [Puia sp.]|nr:ATP-binding protein [Puia sp.]
MNKDQQIRELQTEIDELRLQLFEASETIEAIRNGQVDALVLQENDGNRLYTLKTADLAYRIFIEKMAEGAVTITEGGTILYCNTQFEKMICSEGAGLVGRSFLEFIPRSLHALYQARFFQQDGQEFKEELQLLTKNGGIPVQLSMATFELEGERHINLTLTDLTAQKNAQGQLEAANRLLREANEKLEATNQDLQQFASVASHDLQEPLRKVKFFASLLLETNGSTLSAESRSYFSKILLSTERMKELIIDVLSYSRLSASGVESFVRVDLNSLVKEILDDFELGIQEKGATVTVDRLPCIYANKGQMRQVFQNIISNALKFSKKDIPPRVSIRCSRLREKGFDSPEEEMGPYCLIRVIDNGIGFDKKYQTRIFTLFERLHGKDEYEGSGIGLSIAKRIVEHHNGLIAALSSPGKGSEFLLLLPIGSD